MAMRFLTSVIKSSRGFSLLELMVVVALMATIAVLYVPNRIFQNRVQVAERFAEELNLLLEGASRYHWRYGVFPPDLATLASDMNLAQVPDNPLNPGGLAYSNSGSYVTFTVSFTADTAVFRNVIVKNVPFSTLSGATDVVITLPDTAVFIDEEIKDWRIVTPGETVPKPTCSLGLTPRIVLGLVYLQNPNGRPLITYKLYSEDLGSDWAVHLQIQTDTYISAVDDPLIAQSRIQVVTLCH